jgi:hypothetical protein
MNVLSKVKGGLNVFTNFSPNENQEKKPLFRILNSVSFLENHGIPSRRSPTGGPIGETVHLVFQLPFSDIRSFCDSDTNHVSLPWPLADPGQFVRSFGGVQKRKQGGVDSWAGEEIFSGAEQALRFDPPLGSQRLGPRREMRSPVCTFRRLFASSGPTCRVEAGLRPRSGLEKWQLDGREVLELISTLLSLKVRIGTGSSSIRCEFGDSGKALAAHFLASTTRKIQGIRQSSEPWWVSARDPLLLIEYKSSEIKGLPKFSKRLPSIAGERVSISHCLVDWKGRQVSTWFVRRDAPQTSEEVRDLRINIFRVHAERQCAKEVLRLITQGKLSSSQHLNGASRIGKYIESSLSYLYKPDLERSDCSETLKAIYEMDSLISVGERKSIVTQLTDVKSRFTHAIKDWPATKPNVPQSMHVIGGTVVLGNYEQKGDNNVSTYNVSLGDNNTVAGDFVVAETIQNSFNKTKALKRNPELVEKLKTLHEQTVELSKHLTTEEAREVASDLESFTSEAVKPKPRMAWLQVGASSLVAAAAKVVSLAVPVAESVKNITELINTCMS